MKKGKTIEQLLEDLKVELLAETTQIEKEQNNEKILELESIEVDVNKTISESVVKKKRIFFRPISLIISFFILLLIFYFSSLSKLDKIEVVGNKYLDQFEIIKKSKINIGNNLVSLYTYGAKKRLEQIELIDRVDIHKDLLNRKVVINISEVDPLFYYSDKGKKMIIDVNKNIQSTDSNLSFPIFNNYKDTPINYVKELTDELINVKKSVLNQISEINWMPTKTFKNRFLFKMTDKNYIYVQIKDSYKKLNYYQELRRTLPKDKSVDIFLENSNYFKEAKR